MQWQVLTEIPSDRYFYHLTLAFLVSVVWCILSGRAVAWLRVSAIISMTLMAVGIVRDWKYPAFGEAHFTEATVGVSHAKAGTFVALPEIPVGYWWVPLVKHPFLELPNHLIGRIDLPYPETHVSGMVDVSGWVTGRVSVRKIFLRLDGKETMIITPTYPRRDVDPIFCDSPDRNKGWRTELNLTGFQRGNHILSAIAVADNGTASDIGEVPIRLGS
ncbi:MAG TPA: hypothetical protein VH325_09670 [Bryobacteraceae bacterium]|nr:hypothetical protein [Bryobacteraceae bacterium]